MILKDLLYSELPYITDYAVIDIYLGENKKSVCVLANKSWLDKEVKKYAEHEIDRYVYYRASRRLQVTLKGDLEI